MSIRNIRNRNSPHPEIGFYIPLLGETIIDTARLVAYKLKCQDEWRDTCLGHSSLGFFHKHPFTLKQDRISRKYQVIMSFKILIPTRDDWRRSNQLVELDV